MLTVTTIAAVREHVARWHADGKRVVFVPTMGNLHAGHMSLIETARRHGDEFVASIFVNPMQFGPNEDFAHYPRTPGADAKLLENAGCDLMFMPEVGEIYPNGEAQATRVEVPGISNICAGNSVRDISKASRPSSPSCSTSSTRTSRFSGRRTSSSSR